MSSDIKSVEKRVCVFATARNGSSAFRKDAQLMGRLIAETGYGLVFGGYMIGLMGNVAEEVLDAGLPVHGVVPHGADVLDWPDSFGSKGSYRGITMQGTRTLEERKITMINSADAVIALAGGVGSFDEIGTALELGRSSKKPSSLDRFVILNTAGFYDGLQTQFQRMEKEGFVNPGCLPTFANTPEEAMEIVLFGGPSELGAS